MFYALVDLLCILFLKFCETGLLHDILVDFLMSASHFLSVKDGHRARQICIIEGPQHLKINIRKTYMSIFVCMILDFC